MWLNHRWLRRCLSHHIVFHLGARFIIISWYFTLGNERWRFQFDLEISGSSIVVDGQAGMWSWRDEWVSAYSWGAFTLLIPWFREHAFNFLFEVFSPLKDLLTSNVVQMWILLQQMIIFILHWLHLALIQLPLFDFFVVVSHLHVDFNLFLIQFMLYVTLFHLQFVVWLL